MTGKSKGNAQEKILRALKNQNILITGGAGSVGSALTKKLLEYPVKAVRVLDIDEYGLFELYNASFSLRGASAHCHH